MEATIFTAWIYDHLKPHATAVKVAHPLMLRAIAAAKKKNDRIDAHKIATACDVIFCRSVTWLRRRFASNSETIANLRTSGGQMKVFPWCLFGVGF